MKQLLIIAFIVASLFAGQSVTAKAQESARPNVLIIAIDDLNDWIGCLGEHPTTKTPNIDRLAARGTLFTNAHCQAPICGPSRASLLSGLYPHTTGVYQQPRRKPLSEDTKNFRGHLLPEYFAQSGYETFGCGKITHGYPLQVAFQHTGGGGSSGPKPEQGKRFNYHLPTVPYTGTQTDWGVFPDSDEQMPDHQAADWAIEQLATQHSKPFFLAVGFVRPHVPFYVPQKWFDMHPLEDISLPELVADDLSDVPEIGVRIHELPKYPDVEFLQKNDNEQFRKCVQAYLACISFVDYEVGRVLTALEQSSHADNTIVVLFSDHGYHLGEKDRVSKHSLWEESTRVPLIVCRPGSHKGSRCTRPVGLIDLYPTLLDLCALPNRPRNEGRSLIPLLDDADAPWRHSILTTYARGNHSLRSDRYHYIRYQDGSEELYDHETDPHEWRNVAQQPQLRDVVMQFRNELPQTNAPYHESTDPEPINAWFAEHLPASGVTQ